MRSGVRVAVRRGQALGLAVVAGAVAACGGGPAAKPEPKPRHLVIVTIDTLRADRLGCYGNRDVATPNLDRLSREGAMAPEASVHIALTRPSHTSLFTGLLPSEHGIRDNVAPTLFPKVPTIAQAMKASGFETAAFVSSIVLSSQSGLNRGFDTYGDRFTGDADDARFLNTIQKRGDETLGEAVAWLEGHHAGRVFLWLHLYDPHDPYEPPEPYASRYAGRPYDGEVAWTDELIGRLDAALARLGMREETLLVVTADHGEGLGDHAESVHGFFVYQSTLHVPLLVRGPGIVAGGRLGVTARTVDIAPTVLDLMSVARPPDARFSGRSLAQALRGKESLPEVATYAESLLPLLHFGWSDLRAIREGRWKYIQAPRPELYDLSEDPGEARNLLALQPQRAEALRTALGRILEAERVREHSPAGAGTVPADLVEKLGALGYLGAGAPGQSSSPGADPKDKVEEFKFANRLIREGLIALREKDYAGSVARFRQLLSRKIESFEVHYYLGRALVGLGQRREAEPHFEGAIRYQPAYGMAHRALAECRAARGDLAGAIGALRKGREAAPQDASLPELEAGYWQRRGDHKEAVRAYEAALPLAPKNALLRIRLGELVRDTGDLPRAATLMREAVGLEASVASYWNSFGMVLGAKGDLAEAEKAFREAVSRDAKSALYAFNLGLALSRQGKRYDARPFFEKSLELDPRFAPAREQLAAP
jgi:arylsulfatase A-like enzyme/Tfp pilus assembly protein PilF